MVSRIASLGGVAAGWAAVRTAARGVVDGWRWHRGWLALAAVLYGLLAAVPAVQVLLLVGLLSSLGAGGSAVWWPLLGLTVVVGGFFPLSQVAWQCAHRLGIRLTVEYQAGLVQAAARLSPRQLADPAVVVRMEQADNGANALGPVPGLALQLLGTVATAAGLCVAIWQVSAWAAVLVVAALVPTLVAFTRIAQVEMAGLGALAEASRRARYATELLIQQRSGSELAALQSGLQVADRAIVARRDYRDVLDGLTARGTRLELLAGGLTAVLVGAALAVMVWRESSVVGSAAAISGVISALHAVRASANAFGLLISTTPKGDAYRRFVADHPPVPTVPVCQEGDLLEVAGLSYQYPGADHDTLQDVSLVARRGELVALVGVNGAGKTTAVNCILGTLDPTAGHICLGGQDLSELAEADRLARFGLLTQEFGRYEFTVRQLLQLAGPESYSEVELWRALEAAQADGLVRRLPDGLDTRLGQQWGGVGLSGGEWQRLSLARIYLRDAAVWILDEPTSAIDAQAERDIFDHLAEVKDQHITLLVSHRAWTLRAADHIYVFHDGRIVQHGSYQHLAATPGPFHDLFTDQLT